MSSRISSVEALTPAQLGAVQQLAGAAPGAADTPPISEQATLRLTASAPVRHLLATAPSGALLGYAQLDQAENPVTVELVATDPRVATDLLAAIDGDYRLWAHGEASVANQAALLAGLAPVRTLLQLRRTLPDLQVAEVAPPAGITIRQYLPGQDDAGWLAVNARAFAHHPEQGSWTQRELAERLSASWFDPAGFLVAERRDSDGRPALVGYHWTKVHQETEPPVGEVYVLGIDPAAQGLRLGTVLLNEGLRYLQGRGLESVLLYVEESSGTAIHLYGRAGFTVFARDLQYASS